MAADSTEERRRLEERLRALGWSYEGWQSLSSEWRFRENRTYGKTSFIRGGTELEALRQFLAEVDPRRGGDPTESQN